MTSFLTEPRYGIRYPAPGAVLPDYEAYLQALADDVGTKTAGYSAGLASARPAAGTEGRFYRATDTGIVFFDNGTAWENAVGAGAWQALTPASGWGTNGWYGRLEGDIIRLKGGTQNLTGGSVVPSAVIATLPAGLDVFGFRFVSASLNASVPPITLEINALNISILYGSIPSSDAVIFDGITFAQSI